VRFNYTEMICKTVFVRVSCLYRSGGEAWCMCGYGYGCVFFAWFNRVYEGEGLC